MQKVCKRFSSSQTVFFSSADLAFQFSQILIKVPRTKLFQMNIANVDIANLQVIYSKLLEIDMKIGTKGIVSNPAPLRDVDNVQKGQLEKCVWMWVSKIHRIVEV